MENTEHGDRTKRMIYDPSVGLTVGWCEDPDHTDGEAAKEVRKKAQAVAISGAWVYLTNKDS